ncbi:hypothetical protein HJC22_07835 [Corallococcus exiguus]|nr:hypothetical protein [Corallococcus exiguus]RKH24587.1 hypothetical protein D7V77_20300 [Corallococcus sp. CA041A]RKI16959.1 hypothetical protein D7Y15_11275 [Corallococcus sp. AB030]
MTFQLLLAHSGSGRPVLEEGLPWEAFADAPAPAPVPIPSHLHNFAGPPDQLREQRWALLVPDTPRGRAVEVRLARLCELRSQEQGAPVETYRVPPGMDAVQADDFRVRTLHSWSRPERDHARYVLLAGGLDELSLELQTSLVEDGGCFVGRLAFDEEADYSSYVEKVLAHTCVSEPHRRARAVFLAVNDMSLATRMGQRNLVAPTVGRCREEHGQNHFPASEFLEETLPEGGLERLLEVAGAAVPSLLFTMSHGLGAPEGGWSSALGQRQGQGNMYMGGGVVLTPEELRRRPFLPGGVWFYFACFGAGTPLQSVYEPWMKQFVESGKASPRILESIRQSRPQDGRSFSAALPQAALANPEGPLAVIAHLDMAWIHAFHDVLTGQSHAYRLESVMTKLLQGYRAGVSLQMLLRHAGQLDAQLSRHYQQDAAKPSKDPLPLDVRIQRARLWMERHDVTRYVLLGDPAVRLVEPG